MPRLALVNTISAFLDLIAASEGTDPNPLSANDGYDIIVTGIDGTHLFTDYSTHPFALGHPPIVVRQAKAAVYAHTAADTDNSDTLVAAAVPEILSTASGRYQITYPTWRDFARPAAITVFSPQNQDLCAVALLRRAAADSLVNTGQIPAAIQACSQTWASFPGSKAGQGGRTLEWCLDTYATLLAAQA